MGEQSKTQSKQKRCKSPRSGAEIPCGRDENPATWKPGQSGNPEGGSGKARTRAALNALFNDARSKQLVERVFKDATGKSGSLRFKNAELLLKALGVMKDDSQQVQVSGDVVIINGGPCDEAVPIPGASQNAQVDRPHAQ